LVALAGAIGELVVERRKPAAPKCANAAQITERRFAISGCGVFRDAQEGAAGFSGNQCATKRVLKQLQHALFA
jgi:hypothetical protein